MKFILPIILAIATVVLIGVAFVASGTVVGKTVGIEAGSAMYGLTPKASTPDQALTNLLVDVKRRNWDQAYGEISNPQVATKQSFIQAWTGSYGSLRTFSALESFEVRPMHITNDAAQMRVRLRWTTPIGPLEDVRDFHLAKVGDIWKTVWSKTDVPNVPSQIIPVTYLRWDLVSAAGDDEWGAKNIDAPHVRIISMNPLDFAEGAVVLGEVVNEDTIPAFVNVTATLVDASGNAIDEETSFDKIDHILLPKQVTPYRIDFPKVNLKNVKNVRMNVKATLVPASADPVIGVMNQKVDPDYQGKSVLRGDLLNESGQTVNIPHVIASLYDNNGKVIWVADGYVEHSLLPQTAAPFEIEIPKNMVPKVSNFHVVVNQYSMGRN
jgi:hypothetical protein